MSRRFRVEISEAVKDYLTELAKESRPLAREIALLLLRLEQEPEPTGSRELAPILLEPIAGERLWERPDWTITYWIDHENSVIVAGTVQRSARQ